MNEDGDASVKESRLEEKTVDEKVAIERWYAEQAKTQWENEGEIEVDEGASVSLGGDPGAYVQAWVWVDNPECSKCLEQIKEIEEIPKDGKFICPECKKEAEDGEGD